MIPLRLQADFETTRKPFVVKLRLVAPGETDTVGEREALGFPRMGEAGAYDCRSSYGDFVLRAPQGEELDGDVLMCVPSDRSVRRLFRRGSTANSLLITEKCDQLCVMCSQPPKETDDAWRFPLYEEAIELSDENTVVGITGGEPTLYKDELLGMVARIAKKRSDLTYHVLTNAQHFREEDRSALTEMHRNTSVVWGVPLYSHHEETHDQIVDKSGAFRRLLQNLFVLGSTNAQIELRTVVTALNVFDLPNLANFVAKNIPFVSNWAIMGMEPTGYARANWGRLFFDHSVFPHPLCNAIEICELRGVRCRLFNVPRCTIPERYRGYCMDSISDWKKKFLPECGGCAERALCCGFFEWYDSGHSWAKISPIRAAD